MADLDISLFWDDSPDLWDTLYLGGSPLPGLASVSATHGRKLDSKSAPGTNGARIIDKGYQPAKVDITIKLWTKEQLETWFRLAPTLTYRREPPRTARSSAQTKQAAERARQLAQGEGVLVSSVLTGVSTSLARTGASEQDIVRKQDAEVAAALAEYRRAGGGSTRARSLERHDFDISHPALDTIQVRRVYIEEVSTPNPSGKGVYEVKIKAIESKAPRASATRSVGSGAGSSTSSGSTAGGSWASGIQTAFDAPSPTSTGAAAP